MLLLLERLHGFFSFLDFLVHVHFDVFDSLLLQLGVLQVLVAELRMILRRQFLIEGLQPNFLSTLIHHLLVALLQLPLLQLLIFNGLQQLFSLLLVDFGLMIFIYFLTVFLSPFFLT